jgi:hypothetical protein
MKRLSIILALALFATSAMAHRFNELEIKLSDQMQGQVSAHLNFKKNAISGSKGSLSLLDLTKSKTVKVDVNKNIRVIDYAIDLKSAANLPRGMQRTATLKGKIKLRRNGNFRARKVRITVEGEKFKGKIDCRSIFKIDQQPGKLVIDLSHFDNLSSCEGKDIDEFSPNGIGMRDIADGKNFYSVEDDKRLGREYAEAFTRENSAAMLPEDHPMSVYLQKQMDAIANVSDNPEMRPKVRVINADVLNAFALPGGYVFVFRGLLDRAPSVDAVMGVLGHEWAHVTARHGTKNVTRALKSIYGALFVYYALSIWGNFSKDRVKQILLPLLGQTAVIGAQLYVLNKGRKAELEADRIGSQYAQLAGFKATGLAEMFAEFKKARNSEVTSLEKILSSHPDHDTRIEQNYTMSSLFYPVASDANPQAKAEEFKSVMATLDDPSITPEVLDSVASFGLAEKFIGGIRAQQQGLIKAKVGDRFGVDMSDEDDN